MTNRNKIIILIFVFIFTGKVFALHPLKMSVADMVYKDKKIYLRLKIFADDFGIEVSEFCEREINFDKQIINTETLFCIQKYVNQHFICQINGAKLTFRLKNAKVDDGNAGIRVVWMEYESNHLPDAELIKSIKIQNTLLFRFLGQQKNILNIDLFSGKKQEILQFDNKEGPITKEIVF